MALRGFSDMLECEIKWSNPQLPIALTSSDCSNHIVFKCKEHNICYYRTELKNRS